MLLSLRDPSLDQLIEDLKVEKSADFGPVCLVILEDNNLSLKSVVELPQCLMFTDGILAIGAACLQL